MIPDYIANIVRRNAQMDIEDALRHAISRLTLMGAPNDLPAAVALQDIVQQQGCEHLDTGVNRTGRLVDAISVIVYG